VGPRQRRLVGVAAGCAAVIASMVSAAPASADGHEVCVQCVAPPPTGGNPGGAFLKLAELGFPGNSQHALQKIETP
jgi:hypothetical protein